MTGPFTCAKCGRGHKRRRADGYAHSYCGGCHAAYQREWRRERTAAYHRLRRMQRVARETSARVDPI